MKTRKKITTTVRRISLLLWKNILFRRKFLMIVLTILEICVPTLMVCGLAYYRTIVENDTGVNELNVTYFSVDNEQDLLRPAQRRLKNAIFAYHPDNNLTREIMEVVAKRLNAKPEIRAFENEHELELFVEDSEIPSKEGGKRIRKKKIGAAVIFGPAFENPEETLYMYDPANKDYRLNYTIRIPHYTIDTGHLHSLLQLPGPQHENAQSYRGAGFLGVQIAVDKTIINFVTGEEPPVEISQEVFPYPPYDTTKFNTIFFIPMPAIIVLGFIFIVPSIMRNVVSERQTGIKELMKIMGLPNWMHWFGWMINTLTVLVFSISIVVFVFFHDFDKEKGGIVTEGDWTVWWVVMFLYAMAATAFCFLISVFTTNPVMATTTGIVLWLLSYFLVAIPLALDYENLTLCKKLLSAILPNTALHWAIGVMANLEGKGIGSHWWNIDQPGSTLDGVSLLHMMLILIFDTFFYTSLAMYFENVLPSKYGIRKPWYYPFLLSTWLNIGSRRAYSDASTWNNHVEKPGFESEPTGYAPGIEIQNLSKVYRKKPAVNGISLKMYQGQITALLGHNGAGKTTTLSILTGMFPPTSGTASVHGFDIREELELVRENLGLCPQHNMLFDDLTVLEHLKFFGRLKGLTAFEAHYEAVNLIKKLQMKSKKHVMACNLSGGQKRKLSLGMALVGGSKVVILDEPTSGMDPEARRVIWDLLLALRGERTIVLTTHFMEEADILGDRIAVMANGQLQCCGTPLYLKKYFGAGYILKITVDHQHNQKQSQNNAILHTVKGHIPDGYLMKEEKSGHDSIEMSISIPCDETTGPKLPAMFKELDVNKEALGIQTIGLSLSTIEDVFLALDESNRKEMSSIDMEEDKKNGSVPMAGNERQVRFPSLWKQIWGLMLKKTVYTLRKKRLLAGQFLMPPIMIIVALSIFNTIYVPRENYPSRDITLSQYKDPVVLYTAQNDEFAEKYTDLIDKDANAIRLENQTVVDALVDIGLKDLGIYRDHYLIAAELNESEFLTYFSTVPYHSAPLSVNLATNTIFRNLSNKTYRLDTAFHPLHNLLFSKLEIVKPSRYHFLDGPLMLGIFVPIGLALFASGFLVFPTDERRTQAKQLQLMTGVHPITFWLTSFIFDFTLMTLACCIMIAVIPIFGLERFTGTFTHENALGALFLILIVYGFSSISFSYIFSLIFSSVSLGYSLSTILHLVTGLMLPLMVFIMDTWVKGAPQIMRIIGRLFTTYGVSMSIMRYSSISILNSRCQMLSEKEMSVICDPKNEFDANIRQCCPNCADLTNQENIPQCFEAEKYFTWNYTMTDEKDFTQYIIPGIAQEMLFMVIMGLVYMLIIFVMEWINSGTQVFGCFKRKQDTDMAVKDNDVLAEQKRITELKNKSEDALVVEGVTKYFGSFVAVRNLNFGVHHGECFGLLGVNGAGKTTTFRMLTGDERATHGDAFSLSNSLHTQNKSFLSNIGYCPQFDAIIGVLTGREMLKVFCHLRGVPSKDIDGQVNKWLKKLGLYKSGDVECRNYSGGMKRRLSVGMAMIGDPPVVFLDEPTSGVDPVSRRQFWEVISSARSLGQSIVLTSHSMEECEALCQRLSIMVNGQLQCLGGVEHLKQKFAKGYTLVFRLKSRGLDPERVQALKHEVEQTFTPCVLKDEHQNMIDYQVYNTEMSWDVIFGAMESCKEKYNDLIEDYTVSRTTLEEVFLSFAKLQHSGDRNLKGLLGGCCPC